MSGVLAEKIDHYTALGYEVSFKREYHGGILVKLNKKTKEKGESFSQQVPDDHYSEGYLVEILDFLHDKLKS